MRGAPLYHRPQCIVFFIIRFFFAIATVTTAVTYSNAGTDVIEFGGRIVWEIVYSVINCDGGIFVLAVGCVVDHSLAGITVTFHSSVGCAVRRAVYYRYPFVPVI